MMKNIVTRSIATLLLLTLTLTGCRTSRQTEGGAAYTRKQRNEKLIPLAQYPADIEFVSTKTTTTLNYNGYNVTVKGRLRMRRDETIQMSITALGLMEIASIEFTPEGAYVIDRVNKRYALFDYSSGWMKLAGINFNAVQALFWNRIFIPGEKEAWRKTNDLTISDAGNQCLVEPSRQRMLKCKFYTDGECKELQQTDLSIQQYAATWRYDDFDLLDTYAYPTTHDVSVSNSSLTIGAHIELTNISTLDTGWQSGTDLSRYKLVEFDQLMEILNMIR